MAMVLCTAIETLTKKQAMAVNGLIHYSIKNKSEQKTLAKADQNTKLRFQNLRALCGFCSP